MCQFIFIIAEYKLNNVLGELEEHDLGSVIDYTHQQYTKMTFWKPQFLKYSALLLLERFFIWNPWIFMMLIFLSLIFLIPLPVSRNLFFLCFYTAWEYNFTSYISVLTSFCCLYAAESLEDALKQLYLIDAIDENGLITKVGRTMAGNTFSFHFWRFASSFILLSFWSMPEFRSS